MRTPLTTSRCCSRNAATSPALRRPTAGPTSAASPMPRSSSRCCSPRTTELAEAEEALARAEQRGHPEAARHLAELRDRRRRSTVPSRFGSTLTTTGRTSMPRRSLRRSTIAIAATKTQRTIATSVLGSASSLPFRTRLRAHGFAPHGFAPPLRAPRLRGGWLRAGVVLGVCGIVLAIVIALDSGGPDLGDRRRRPPRTTKPPTLPPHVPILEPRRSSRTPCSRIKRLRPKHRSGPRQRLPSGRRSRPRAHIAARHPNPPRRRQRPPLITSRSSGASQTPVHSTTPAATPNTRADPPVPDRLASEPSAAAGRRAADHTAAAPVEATPRYCAGHRRLSRHRIARWRRLQLRQRLERQRNRDRERRRLSPPPPSNPTAEYRRRVESPSRRARSSVGERSLHTREVAGSSPAVPIRICRYFLPD